MATVTKTFSNNYGDSNTWTVTITGTDQTVSGNFTLAKPSVTVKYNNSTFKYISCYFCTHPNIFSNVRSTLRYERPNPAVSGGVTKFTSSSANTNYALTYTGTSYSGDDNITLSNVFDENNKTSTTYDVILTWSSYYVDTYLESQGGGLDGYYSPSSSGVTLGKVATITLNAPPTVTLGTPTYSNPQYAGLGSYTVPITSASALYGGDITKVTLTVGQDSTVQTYSSSSISNQTISVTPTVAGTYTPTLTVEDSRGQTTTETLADITVNPYLNPSLDFDVFRSNSSGVRDDEGAYGLVTANVSFTDAIADLTQPTVKINGTTTNNVTWYSSYSSSTGVASAISDWTAISSGDTIYGLINGSFSQTDSYSITVSLTDSLGGNSAEITQTLSTAFYTIDFQAGGKEIAFGAPADDNLSGHSDGLFKCGMDAWFNGDIRANGYNSFVIGDTEIENPFFSLDTTAAPGTTDGDLYAAIVALGWDSDLIV